MRASSFAGGLLLAGLPVQIACGQGSSPAQAYTVTIAGSSVLAALNRGNRVASLSGLKPSTKIEARYNQLLLFLRNRFVTRS